MKSHRLDDFSPSEIGKGKAFIADVIQRHIQLNFEDYIDKMFTQLSIKGNFTSSDSITFNISLDLSASLLLGAMRKRGRK